MTEGFPLGHARLAVGGLDLANPLWLAPLAGVTVPAVRAFFRRLGVALTHTEMVSAAGIVMSNKKTEAMVASPDGRDRPLVMQLFGDDPLLVERGARRALAVGGFDALGLNMACPMPKVFRKGSGARLLEMPERAREMVLRLSDLGLPLWVKLRKTTAVHPLATEDFAAALIEAGADHLTLHGRTAAQRYEGVADREAVLSLARAFPGRVSASGDVFSVEAIRSYLDGGCVGVFLARGILRDPFLVPRALAALGYDVDESLLVPAPERELDLLMEMGRALLDQEGERFALVLLKRFVSCMFKGFTGASAFRRAVAVEMTWEGLSSRLIEGRSLFRYETLREGCLPSGPVPPSGARKESV